MDNTRTPWPRRSAVAHRPAAPVCCEECGTLHRAKACPECGNPPDGLMVGVLSTEITTLAGDRWLVNAERDDHSGGWTAVGASPLDGDEDSGTRWESGP